MWSYSHGSKKKIPSWLIEYQLLNYRIPAWVSWSLDLKGLLYWQTAAWSKKDLKIDPWINSKTRPDTNFAYGEASLIYPGHDAGIDGPVASMRLKIFRDSVEDYDYFSVLGELIGPDEVRKIVTKVASSYRVYTKEADDYTQTRRLVAEKIVQKIGK